MAKGLSYHQRVHRHLVAAGECSRPEIRSAVGLTPKQLDCALSRLISLGYVAYNGVCPHRLYYATRSDEVKDRRGTLSGKTQFGRVVRPNWDASDHPLHPPVTLAECMASPSLHALERAWASFLSTKKLAFRKA